jgi:hypothetical protein
MRDTADEGKRRGIGSDRRPDVKRLFLAETQRGKERKEISLAKTQKEKNISPQRTRRKDGKKI